MRISSRFLRTALTSALLCAVFAATASAANYGSGVVTENSLRLRQGANTSSAILTRSPAIVWLARFGVDLHPARA